MFTKLKITILIFAMSFEYVFATSVIIFEIPSPAPEVCLNGEIYLKIRIEADGTVSKAKILKKSDNKLLNKEAKKSALEIKYAPLNLEERKARGIKKEYSSELIGINFFINKKSAPQCYDT